MAIVLFLFKLYKTSVAITSLEELENHIKLTESEKSWKECEENTLPVLISDNIMTLIDNPAIRRQFVPCDK